MRVLINQHLETLFSVPPDTRLLETEFLYGIPPFNRDSPEHIFEAIIEGSMYAYLCFCVSGSYIPDNGRGVDQESKQVLQ